MNMLTGWPSRNATTVGMPWLFTAEQRVAHAVGIDVELGEQERTVALAGDLLQDGSQGLARSAPGGPQVHDDRPLLRPLDHQLLRRSASVTSTTLPPCTGSGITQIHGSQPRGGTIRRTAGAAGRSPRR